MSFLRNRLQIEIVLLRTLNRTTIFVPSGITYDPRCRGAALSMMACLLWSLGGCTLVGFAQMFPFDCENLLHKEKCALLLQQRSAPNAYLRGVLT